MNVSKDELIYNFDAVNRIRRKVADWEYLQYLSKIQTICRILRN